MLTKPQESGKSRGIQATAAQLRAVSRQMRKEWAAGGFPMRPEFSTRSATRPLDRRNRLR
jgi:hypothetical protein